MRLAIVCPCYNEQEVLPQSAQRLTDLLDHLIGAGKVSSDSFMMFVNDGSRDRTWEVITQLHESNKYVKGVNLARNVGHQNAIMAGMMTARDMADGVVTIDADLQDDLKCIPTMVDDFAAGYDIVYGVKVSREKDPVLKRLTAVAFYKLQEKMGVECVYNHADFRFMSRRALQMLSEYGERNLYLRGLIPMIGLHSTTVDDVISERTAGKSKYNLSRMLGLALDGITSFSVKPILGIIYLGMLSMFIGLGIGCYVVGSLIMGTAVKGWSSLMLSIWLSSGMLMISIGIVGIYIGKIYNEVKRRPLYHIDKILE